VKDAGLVNLDFTPVVSPYTAHRLTADGRQPHAPPTPTCTLGTRARSLQILSVTLFEKMPVEQALSAAGDTPKDGHIRNQLQLFEL
jgi:hypothetical protein